MSATALNHDTFETYIQSGVSLVDFWAPWCGPCQIQLPIVEQLAQTMDHQAQIATVNVDENSTLAAHYGIRSIPTLLLFKDGQLIDQMSGVQQQSVLASKIVNALHN
ncbi:thioredoxin [Paenibacillus sp. WLX2291]|uniref:thioredoxin n=1 Tax=Paenibacillus sp. WLX2291 TaxID=3296934 RepID=UPI003984546C